MDTTLTPVDLKKEGEVSDEASKEAINHFRDLVPEAQRELLWQLRKGTDKQRFVAATEILDRAQVSPKQTVPLAGTTVNIDSDQVNLMLAALTESGV
jgi:hypothetical protein